MFSYQKKTFIRNARSKQFNQHRTKSKQSTVNKHFNANGTSANRISKTEQVKTESVKTKKSAINKWNVYNFQISWLILPGKMDLPVSGSFTSPSGLMVALRRGSSWLYSTLHVMVLPSSLFTSFAIAPTACLAKRGTHTEFTSRSSSVLTPSTAARVAPGTRAVAKVNAMTHMGRARCTDLTKSQARKPMVHSRTHASAKTAVVTAAVTPSRPPAYTRRGPQRKQKRRRKPVPLLQARRSRLIEYQCNYI